MSSESHYVVRRLNWKSPIAGRYVRLPGWAEVATFDTAELAEADRRRRELEVRGQVSPFDCAESLFELSSLPAFMFADWLMDGGLEPPAPETPFEPWRQWWAKAAGTMTDAERTHTWAGCDKLRFFDVAEQSGTTVYVVQGVHWEYDFNHNNLEARFEGGHPLAVFRSVATAEMERRRSAAEIQARLREEHDEYYSPRYVLTGSRAEAGRDPFVEYQAGEVEVTAGAEPFAETVPVSVAAAPAVVKAASLVYLVQRLSWSWEATNGAVSWQPQLDTDRTDGMPVAAFLKRKDAETLAWELDFADRLYLNPFRFGHPVDLSSIAELGFRSVLGDAGLDLPADDWNPRSSIRERGRYEWEEPSDPIANPWEEWWAQTADVMSIFQRDAVWDLLDQLRFHQVIELELQD